jgi:ubiquinone/menaquinone biosynthesis C-methylase UbiE
MLKRYVVDIAALMGEIHRVLRPRGKCVLVVGDSSLDGVFVRNSRLVKEIANSSGLRFIREYRRRIPDSRRYLPPPSSQRKRKNLALRMRTEVVLVFAVKSAGVRVRSRA